MGGCKCSYRSCKRNSDRKTHFFHYPVRHQERCLQWMINSNRMDYQDLQISQLKNKVICQYHFEDKMFINYKHDRLVHNAVPTPEESNEIKCEYYPPRKIEDDDKKLDLPNDSTFEKNSKEESMMSVIISPITGLSFISPVEKKKKCAAPYIELLTRKHNFDSNLESQKSISVSTPMRNITSSPKESSYNNTPFLRNVKKQDKPNNVPTNNTPVTNNTNPRMASKAINNKTNNFKNSNKTTAINQENQSDEQTLKYENEQTIEITEPEVQYSSISQTCAPITHNITLQNSSIQTIVSPKSHILIPPQTIPIKSERIVSQMRVMPSIAKARLATSKDIVSSKVTQNINKPIRAENRVNILDVVSLKNPLPRISLNSSSQSVEVQTYDDKLSEQLDCMKLIQENTKEIIELKKQLLERKASNSSSSKRSFEIDDNEDDNMKKALLYAQIVPYLTPKLAKKVHAEMFPLMAKRRKITET